MSSPNPNRTVLAFFAHPDDAEIQCGGTLIRLARLGWEVHIATATAGDCGSPDKPADEVAAIRREEGRRAAEKIGARYHCLELRDVRVCYDPESISRTIDLFRRVAPSLLLTHPRHDYMMDHEQTHLLARNASFSYSIPNASALPIKAGSRIPHVYYTDPVEHIDPYTGQQVTPSRYIDVSEVIEQKLEMLACHESQREWLRSHHGMDSYLETTRERSRTRGQQIGASYAEAFVQHRGHPYPQDDVLGELLG